MKKAIIVGLLFCLCAASSFSQDSESIAELKTVISDLERKIINLETRLSELERTYEFVLNTLSRGDKAPDILSLSPLSGAIQEVPTEEGPWTDKANWRRLQKGMTREAVARILGEPERIDRGIAFEFWYYPNGGDVDFNDSGRVTSWSEPR